MFDVLPASRSHLVAQARWVTTSLIAHILVVAAAVLAGRGALGAMRPAAPEQSMMVFVVDTSGRVEPASVRIIESSHHAFDDAAGDAVVRARFQPARLRGQPVRQITRQRVRFVATN